MGTSIFAIMPGLGPAAASGGGGGRPSVAPADQTRRDIAQEGTRPARNATELSPSTYAGFVARSGVLPFVFAPPGGDQRVECVKPHTHYQPYRKTHSQRCGRGPPLQGAGDEERASDEADRPQRGPHGVVRGVFPVFLLVDQREAGHQYRREGGKNPADRLRGDGPNQRRDHRDRAAEGEADGHIFVPRLPDPPRLEPGDEMVPTRVVPGRWVAHFPPPARGR